MGAARPIWSRGLREFKSTASPGFRKRQRHAVNRYSGRGVIDRSAALAIRKGNNDRLVEDYVRVTANRVSIFDIRSKRNGAIGGSVKQDGGSCGLVCIINQERVNVREG